MSGYTGPPRTERPVRNTSLPPTPTRAPLLPPEQDFDAIESAEEQAQTITARLAAAATLGLAVILLIAGVRAVF